MSRPGRLRLTWTSFALGGAIVVMLFVLLALLLMWPGPRGPEVGSAITEWQGSLAGDIWVNTIGMRLAFIPAGDFLMGSPVNEAGRRSDETQQHIHVSQPFLIGVVQVTQEQWEAVMGTNPSNSVGKDLPVEMVSWHDAVEFCRRLSEREHRQYRLPTEAEWEYACRAGTSSPYHSGTTKEDLSEVAWYSANTDRRTHPVGMKRANNWGLYDMHGNVWEWCADWYHKRSTSEGTPTAGRVIRGGSCADGAQDLRSASRSWNDPHGRASVLGFRVVVDLAAAGGETGHYGSVENPPEQE